MKNTYNTRLDRVAEQKGYKKLVMSVVIGILAFIAILLWGVPSIISLSVFVSSMNKKNADMAVKTVDNSPVFPPTLESIIEATNSASISITGYSDPDNSIDLFLNTNLSDTTKASAVGVFVFNNIQLDFGNNSIYVVAQRNDIKSDKSQTYNIFYKKTLPKLEVAKPENDSKITGSKKEVQVTGLTDYGSIISINDHIVVVNADGSFSYNYPLNDGDNSLKIIATDQAGNQTAVERKVNYSP